MSARVTCSCGWTRTYPTRARAEFNARRHVCTAGRKPKARRATRRYRCKRCGLEATYDDITATEGRSYFNRHSCRKVEDAMLRAAMREGRMALIDRTPKPCLHKVADHQHGTNAAYVLDKCRCEPCCKARAAQDDWRRRQKAYGRYQKYVPAEFVRQHLAELAAYGIGLKTVSKLSGVSNGSLTKIVYGAYAPSTGPHKGCKGNGKLLRGPANRVLRSTAERIYDVEAVPANLPPRTPDTQRTPTARLHLRALVAIGWSMSELGNRLGMKHRGNATALIIGDRTLQRATVDRIEALYAQLSMTLPPETNQRQRISVSRSRRYARDRGWLPPLALEDTDGVELEDSRDIDEVAIQRRMAGDRSVRLSKVEKAELRRRWIEAGRPLRELERVTGVHSTRDYDQEAS